MHIPDMNCSAKFAVRIMRSQESVSELSKLVHFTAISLNFILLHLLGVKSEPWAACFPWRGKALETALTRLPMRLKMRLFESRSFQSKPNALEGNKFVFSDVKSKLTFCPSLLCNHFMGLKSAMSLLLSQMTTQSSCLNVSMGAAEKFSKASKKNPSKFESHDFLNLITTSATLRAFEEISMNHRWRCARLQ